VNGDASLRRVPVFMLSHAHRPDECAIAIAAWKGFHSPLRHSHPVGSCASGGHRVWWLVEAPGRDAAVAQLPPYVADRTTADEVRDVPIP
jgi:hypothetical protein